LLHGKIGGLVASQDAGGIRRASSLVHLFDSDQGAINWAEIIQAGTRHTAKSSAARDN
jgi:hypothetical protein